MGMTHSLDYRVQLDDLDFMGHVNHARWIALCERMRTSLFAEGFAELLKQQVGLVVAEVKAKYEKPAFFNEPLRCEIIFEQVNPKAFVARQSFLKVDGAACMKAEILLVAVDAKGKPVTLPQMVKDAIEK